MGCMSAALLGPNCSLQWGYPAVIASDCLPLAVPTLVSGLTTGSARRAAAGRPPLCTGPQPPSDTVQGHFRFLLLMNWILIKAP